MKCRAILCALATLMMAVAIVADEAPIRKISVEDLQKRLQSDPKPLLVDVREPDEYEAAHIEGAQLAPLGEVEKHLDGVARDREIYLVCHSGRRSAKAYGILAEHGYTNLTNVDGGMLAWEKAGLPVVRN